MVLLQGSKSIKLRKFKNWKWLLVKRLFWSYVTVKAQQCLSEHSRGRWLPLGWGVLWPAGCLAFPTLSLLQLAPSGLFRGTILVSSLTENYAGLFSVPVKWQQSPVSNERTEGGCCEQGPVSRRGAGELSSPPCLRNGLLDQTAMSLKSAASKPAVEKLSSLWGYAQRKNCSLLSAATFLIASLLPGLSRGTLDVALLKSRHRAHVLIVWIWIALE